MKPVIAVFDGFFGHAYIHQDEILSGTFTDVVNMLDGITYPGINKNIPIDVETFMRNRLEEIMGRDIDIVTLFARMTSKATGVAPHRIHCDRVMAHYSAHVYLSTSWPPEAGTTFWNHKTEGGMWTEDTDMALVTNDSHDVTQWEHSFTCQGAFNRLLIHDSRLWHSAEPAGGWGDKPSNARVVLTCFFSPKL